MFVLGRKPNESIVIRDDLRVTIRSVHKNQVRVGIEASSSVTIHRRELTASGAGQSHPHACRLARALASVPMGLEESTQVAFAGE